MTFSTTSSVNVYQSVCGRTVCVCNPFHLCKVFFLNAGMTNCPPFGQSGTGIRGTQSSTGMLRYRSEILDSRMPMPAASAWMPMPSSGNTKPLRLSNLHKDFAAAAHLFEGPSPPRFFLGRWVRLVLAGQHPNF